MVNLTNWANFPNLTNLLNTVKINQFAELICQANINRVNKFGQFSHLGQFTKFRYFLKLMTISSKCRKFDSAIFNSLFEFVKIVFHQFSEKNCRNIL